MIPSILSSQVQKGVEDFLKTTFPVTVLHGLMDRFLGEDGGIFDELILLFDRGNLMIPKVIETEKDYQKTLARIEDLMDSEPRTPEGEELEMLSALVGLYEEKQYPIALPDPVEAIKFRMVQMGLRQ
jgi:hypothetical protein